MRLSATAGAGGVFPCLNQAALIRELHVYGQLITTYTAKDKDTVSSQHAGFGSRLMEEAERIAYGKGFRNMAVIAGVGTRNYYRKLGYTLTTPANGSFLVKGIRWPARVRAEKAARRAGAGCAQQVHRRWSAVAGASRSVGGRMVLAAVVMLVAALLHVQVFYHHHAVLANRALQSLAGGG